MDVLTLNCGSSSVKYQLYRWGTRTVLARGIVERVGLDGSFIKHYSKGKGTTTIKRTCGTHTEAIRLLVEALAHPQTGAIKDLSEIQAVGHRVVHGGEKFIKSVLIDDVALRTFEELSDLAPLHNPANIAGIRGAAAVLPGVPQCAVMDTAWHQTMPRSSFLYALPYDWYTKYAIRRYGFHGTSFLYVSKRAAVLLGQDPFRTNLICLHIGNGASANAVRDGLSFDTSMGFTPLEGLVMGTRAGDHDAAIGYYVMRKESLDAAQVDALLNKKSGLLGITGQYTDRRDVETAAERGDERAALAMEIEGYRLRKYVGAYCAALGRVDAVVFTAGVGERGPRIRQLALQGLENLGIVLDPQKNALSQTRHAETEITGSGSRIRVFVIPTDEELVMTEDTVALIQGGYDVHTRFTYTFQTRDYMNAERLEPLEEDLRANPGLDRLIARIP